MSLVSFLKLVEIPTKVASVIPFTLGTLYSIYHFGRFNLRNFIILFIALISFDMVTTAINNYYDYKKAHKTHGYGYESHNAIVKYNLKESTVLFTIFSLLAVASVFGFLLFLNTTPVTLLLGALSFAVGILYSFGPIPISRTPLGEILSGLFMGFIIVFISIYAHVYDMGFVNLAFEVNMLGLSFNLKEVIYIFLLSIPTVNGIANIMLANNICDIEEDLENRRYTLPIYVGREKALSIFKALYYIAYIDLIVLLAFGITPVTTVVTLFTFIPVNRNISSFYKNQSKKDTFILAVKNFLIINAMQVLAIGGGLIIQKLI
ncbi:MAG TPA: 1,4-dihydroxy-2-naphthoate polyprenyltransferase [Patescibacteria group bacterium]|nr:1,4-dihydroxy-2-naphthoate polyprenyltransferase [Patescibacteria group bacterium]